MALRIVVTGASAAGLRAAARAKRLLPGAEVLVLDAGEIISYGACGLPYFVAGEIQSLAPLRSTLWGAVRDPEFFRRAKALDVRTGKCVLSIDRAARVVRFADVDTGQEETAGYDRLLLATGAVPRTFPGFPENHPRVSVFKTAEDGRRWREALEGGGVESVAIVGAGYLGCELAEAFGGMWGCRVELIEAAGQVLPQVLDPEMAAPVEEHLTQQGVVVRTGCACERVAEEGGELILHTTCGPVRAGHAIAAMGFLPNARLAAEAGLAIGPSGGIAVDEHLRTSDPDILAAGDCIEVRHVVSGRPAYIPLGSLANRQGRVAGDVLAGREARFGPVAGSGAVKVFELNVAATGLSQAAAERAGIATEAVWGTFSDKAHYYPGDQLLRCKLVYERGTGRLVGFQAIGAGEVVRRVDVFAGLLARGGTIADLLDVEHAYAPPFAPAVDLLYVLGCAAQNQTRDGVRGAPPSEALEGYRVLDVRTAGEAQKSPVPGALNVPLEELRARLSEVPHDRPLMVVCSRGARSAEAARILLSAGIPAVTYLGGGVAMRRAR